MSEKQIILVVDDTPENIDIISSLLRQTYKVKAAINGERALKIAGADVPPDLILLDIMMPEMDGYEVITRLKADPKTADIPVVFLTADVSAKEKGMSLGAVDFVTKPIDPNTVQVCVAKILAG